MRNLKESLPALLLASLAACKSAPAFKGRERPTTKGTGTITPPAADALHCEAMHDMDDLYAAVPWTSHVDGISFYAVAAAVDNPGVAGTQLGYVHGTPCRDASAIAARDRIANEYAVAATNGQGWVHRYAPQHRAAAFGFAVVSRAGVHEIVSTLAALRGLLGPLTTISAAQAWAAIDPVGIGCKLDSKTAVVVGQGWFDLPTTFEQCVAVGGGVSANVTMLRPYRVYADGRIEELPSREVERRPAPGGCIMVGRRPVAMLDLPPPPLTFAALLAQTAQLEAAAAIAFAELAASLGVLGAPVALIARAEKAQHDEIRHASIMFGHAAAHGASVTLPNYESKQYADEFALALHNAREGCVHETYGALVALHQAQFAQPPALRADLQQIAADEVAHAQWSHDLDAWLATRLTAEQRATVAAAKNAACIALLTSVAGPPSAAQQQFGLPTQHVAARLARGLHRQMNAMSGASSSMS